MKGAEPIFIDKGAGTGVLMLHGFSSTPRQFKELSEYLAGLGLNVSAPLIAGHGTSPEDFMKTSPQDWTNSAMDAYLRLKKISKKVFIVGNSFGSNLGFWLAKELNNEPAGIVTLGAPIFLKFHNFIKLRLFTYGRFRKFYKKPRRIYRGDFTDVSEEISYDAIPVKNLNAFINFLENETAPNLKKIKIPILIASAEQDSLVHPKSVNYIFENIGSQIKEIFWFKSSNHGNIGKECEGLFCKIYEFIKGLQ